MPIGQLLIGNDNDVLIRPFQEAFSGDVLTSAEIYCTVGEYATRQNVIGATNATPIVITTEAAHGLTTGDFAVVLGVGGNGAAKGTWEVTVISPTQFSLDTSVGDGDYTDGGQCFKALDDPAAREIEIESVGDGQYRGVIPGTIGLDINGQYLIGIYCAGSFRDKYSEINKAVARVRGGGL